ncbi:MAG: hypothetical protein HQL56_16730, partial [Magnetococcales bacterium]|nr:hypothetical protein [Magnetococcales bacterium]
WWIHGVQIRLTPLAAFLVLSGVGILAMLHPGGMPMLAATAGLAVVVAGRVVRAQIL